MHNVGQVLLSVGALTHYSGGLAHSFVALVRITSARLNSVGALVVKAKIGLGKF